jgi:hypothetical protein
MQFKRGILDQLQRRTEVSFGKSHKRHKSAMVEFIDWSPEEESCLSTFSPGKEQGGTLTNMFGSFYAVALRQEDNITQNPGCEWQLGLY